MFVIGYHAYLTNPLKHVCDSGTQGGRFDFADRLFHSVAEAYRNCTNSDSDVKELVPEFYSSPEFLKNRAAELPLGTRQVRIQSSGHVIHPSGHRIHPSGQGFVPPG
eukprot:1160127-Pyramimonas_sp.AAC.1